MTTTVFPSVGLVGLGTMGSGIAHVIAASGRDVVVLEASKDRIDDGISSITSFLDSGIERGKTTVDDKLTVLGRIRGVTEVAELAGVDAVIESATENVDVKKSILAQVANVVGADVPILTNTSALSVTDLAASLNNPSRVAGLHFFNPAPIMRTVEIVRALQTSDELVDRLLELVDSFDGKSPIVVKDRPGFLINALLLPYLNDVIGEFDDGLATAEDIDVALELGLGYKTGPMALLDMIGLDVHLHATKAAYDATLDSRYAPPPLLQQMVAAGYLGTKNGKGFRTDRKTMEKN